MLPSLALLSPFTVAPLNVAQSRKQSWFFASQRAAGSRRRRPVDLVAADRSSHGVFNPIRWQNLQQEIVSSSPT